MFIPLHYVIIHFLIINLITKINIMRTAVILEAEDYEKILADIREIKQDLIIQRLIVQHYGWIKALAVMSMGLHGLYLGRGEGSREAKELTIDYSKKKARVSAMSLVDLLRRRG